MEHSKFLFSCIEKNTPADAESYLNSLREEERKAAVQFRINRFVLSHLAEENHDAPLHGVATVQTPTILLNYSIKHPRLVSLLALAAWKGSIGMVDLLLKHGADINAAPISKHHFVPTIDLYYPPVIVACSCGEMEIAKLLLKRGADVTDHRGGNCLKLCIKNEEFVRVLVAHGADVNAEVWIRKDEWGEYQPLLQYAVQYEDISVVTLLLDLGADPRRRSWEYYEDALQFTCRYRKRDVVDLLLGTMGHTLKEKIEAYRLIGASWMNGEIGYDIMEAIHNESDNDVAKAMLYWTEAMELLTTAQPPVTMDYPSVPTKPFGIEREPRTVDELKELMSQPDGAHMYAVLVREQILGSHSKLAIKIMHYCAERLTTNRQYDRAINLYNYILLYLAKPNASFENFFWDFDSSLDSLCNCGEQCGEDNERSILFNFRQTHVKLHSNGIFVKPEVLQDWVDAGLELMEKLLIKIKTVAPAIMVSWYEMILLNHNLSRHYTNDLEIKRMAFEKCYYLIISFLLVLDVMLKLSVNLDSSARLKTITVELMRICSNTRTTGPLLSYAARDRISVSPDVFNYLLQCSRDRSLPNVYRGLDEALRALTDELQELSASKRIEPADKADIESQIRPYVLLLLSKGAHADATNGKGDRLVDVFRPLIPDFDPFPYETLQCLAARVVKRFGGTLLPENVPKMVIDFVHIH